MSRFLSIAFATILISLTLVIAPAQASPASQLAVEFEGEVLENANLRQGPGTDYSVVGGAQAGEHLIFDGCNQDCEWYHLKTGEWIAGFLVGPLPMPANPSTDDLVFAPPSLTAKEIVSEILSFSGLPRHFAILSANIYDAAAVTVEGQRVILYDPELMAGIEYYTANHWSAISILAHEIGHHLAGHTLSTATDASLADELEADYFSGFVLYKMGATLEEAQSAIQIAGSKESTATHPGISDRLAAIEAGWREAASQRGQEALPPPPPNLDDAAPVLRESELFPDGFGEEVGCWPLEEGYRIVYIFEAGHDGDPYYILQDEQGRRDRYYLAEDNLSNTSRSWVPTIMQPGRRLKVGVAYCGATGAYLYLSYVEPLDAVTGLDVAPVHKAGGQGNPQPLYNSQDFSPLIFCRAEEFDASTGRCTRYRTQFSGLVESIYVSWTPSAASQGAEFTKVWYLDGQYFLTSTSQNEFGYVEVATRTNLKPGQYQLDVFVDDELVQQGIFTIR